MLPFSREQFLALFAVYNEAIWPVQILAYALAMMALPAMAWGGGKAVAAGWLGLAAMWVWTGIAYHWLYFAPVNGAARLFAAMFVGEGLMIALLAGRLGPIRLHAAKDAVGFLLILYSLFLYPLVGLASGRELRSLPWFGVAPCPLVLFTLGLLLLCARGARALLPIPLAWSLVGGTAAFLLGMWRIGRCSSAALWRWQCWS